MWNLLFPDRSQVFIIFRQICMEQASANPFFFSSSESSYYSVLVSIPCFFFFFNMNEQIFCSEIGLFSAIRARIGGGWIGLRIGEFGLKSARIEDLCDK